MSRSWTFFEFDYLPFRQEGHFEFEVVPERLRGEVGEVRHPRQGRARSIVAKDKRITVKHIRDMAGGRHQEDRRRPTSS
jgi:hypothetical protein